MRVAPISLSSPIEDKIAWAERNYRAIKDDLRRDNATVKLLGKLSEAIQVSRDEMVSAGIVGACRSCEHVEGGSCCGAGLEDKYDGVLLLINLLLDVKLPEQKAKEDSCYFLGKNGCLLAARDVICVNYLCRKVTASIDGPRKLFALRAKEGVELDTLFRLHERVKEIIWGGMSTGGNRR